MTCEEFSTQFDIRLNSFANGSSSPLDIVCDEYEKSMYLTKAQKDLVIELYNGKNNFNDSFESTEEVRRYINKLVRTFNKDIATSEEAEHIKSGTYFIQLPQDIMFIVFEQATISSKEDSCMKGTIISVVPTSHDYFNRQKSNPFREPNNRRVLRLDSGIVEGEDNTIELISKYSLSNYYCRYVSRPMPIILTDLPDGLSIEGTTVKTECKLTDAVHNMILDNAVKMALAEKMPKFSSSK